MYSRLSKRFISDSVDIQFRRQQWKRLNKLKRLGLVSITSCSLLYYYYYSTRTNNNNKTFKSIFGVDTVIVEKPYINKHGHSKQLLKFVKDPNYTSQFIPHSIFVSNNDKKSKYFGLLQRIASFENKNIEDICILPEPTSQNEQSGKVIGYYIDGNGDLFKWGSSSNENDKIVKVLLNYKFKSIKYSNNQIYSLSNDGNIYIFPTDNDEMISKHLIKSMVPFGRTRYTYKIENVYPKDRIVQFDTGENHLVYVTEKGKACFVFTGEDKRNTKEMINGFSIMDEVNMNLGVERNKPIDLILLNNELVDDHIQRIVPRKIIKVACGKNHSMALSEDGRVFTFGNNKHGQLGHSVINYKNVDIPFPREIPSIKFKPYSLDSKPIDIFSMSNTSFILLSNKGEETILLSIGDGQLGQLGNNSYKTFQCEPTRVRFDGHINNVITNSYSDHAFIIDEKNQIWTFGNNEKAQLMLGNYYNQNKPMQVKDIIPNIVDYKKIMLAPSSDKSYLILNE